MDLVDWGGDLAVIIKAGGWNCSAFKFYLETRSVEKMAVSKAQQDMLDHSSESEMGDLETEYEC